MFDMKEEKKMTNAMIIFNESVRLMENGILKGTWEFVTVEEADGTKKELEMPEQIHTYAAWQQLGYKVKKGEKAIAKFNIWKHTTKIEKVEDQEEETSKMFMKMSAFFKFSQVQKVV